jgi:hypothetical protein
VSVADEADGFVEAQIRGPPFQFGSQRPVAHAHEPDEGKFLLHRGKSLQQDSVSLLELQAGDGHQHRSFLRESKAPPQIRRGRPIGLEAFQVSRIVDDDDLPRRPSLPRDQVTRVRLRDGDADVDAGADDPVAERPQPDPTSRRWIIEIRGSPR